MLFGIAMTGMSVLWLALWIVSWWGEKNCARADTPEIEATIRKEGSAEYLIKLGFIRNTRRHWNSMKRYSLKVGIAFAVTGIGAMLLAHFGFLPE